VGDFDKKFSEACGLNFKLPEQVFLKGNKIGPSSKKLKKLKKRQTGLLKKSKGIQKK